MSLIVSVYLAGNLLSFGAGVFCGVRWARQRNRASALVRRASGQWATRI